MKDDDIDIYDDADDFSDSWGYEPKNLDPNTFKLRNDPDTLLKSIRLELMNAYEKEVTYIDDEGIERTKTKIVKKKNTEPKANEEGIEDIISYLRKFINNHVVQGNIPTEDKLILDMKHISQDITAHFHNKRESWEISHEDIDTIISTCTNLVYFFLTRLLFNEERKSYGESFKESSHKEIKERPRNGMFQKMGRFFAGGG